MDQALLSEDPVAVLSRYGSTFRWAGYFLPAGTLTRAARLYRFLRFLDDLADEAGNDTDLDTRTAMLQEIRARLDLRARGTDDGTRHLPMLVELHFLLDDIGIRADVLDALMSGMSQDVDNVLITTKAELLRYSYRVAGTVGLMMCEVLEVRNPAAHAFAIDLGIAMQLTNICRDVLEDANMGRRYLPLAFPVADLLAADCPQDALVRQAMLETLALAERYYESGMSGLGYLPWRVRWTIACAGVLYRAIGLKLLKLGLPWQNGRVYLSTREKVLTVLWQLPSLIRLVMAKPRGSHKVCLHADLEGLPSVHSQ
jgi:phytoene synthase